MDPRLASADSASAHMNLNSPKLFEYPVFKEMLARVLLVRMHSLLKLHVKRRRPPLHRAKLNQQLQVKISKYSCEWHPNSNSLKWWQSLWATFNSSKTSRFASRKCSAPKYLKRGNRKRVGENSLTRPWPYSKKLSPYPKLVVTQSMNSSIRFLSLLKSSRARCTRSSMSCWIMRVMILGLWSWSGSVALSSWSKLFH